MHETAFAKLNLALHVRGRRPDGYHRVETVFAFARDGDALSVAASDDLALEVTGPFAAGLSDEPDNLVLSAARALRDRFAVARGARLTLDKRLPVAAGIGGGSADAAAALRLLTRWWELPASDADLRDLAALLGADVPACLLSRSCRGEGKGDELRPLAEAGLAGTPVLLVNPRVPLSTVAMFRAWDDVDRGPLADWREGRNDLAAAAIGLVPAIAEVLAALSAADFARMSGSGATCFGLYSSEDERDSAAAAIAAAQPHWWTLATRLR
ncbi:MAG: 4-(cytidine 5'-diphospho)-2-C-methyl-D-erythritol kinase [Allosphingosinicella sp.]